jgi:Flp pilus assembly protein TadD
VSEYRKAVALAPGAASTHIGLGVALAQTGKPEEGLNELMRVLDSDPRNASANNSAGAVLAGMGRTREALGYFETAARLNPADEGARRNVELARSMLAR